MQFGRGRVGVVVPGAVVHGAVVWGWWYRRSYGGSIASWNSAGGAGHRTALRFLHPTVRMTSYIDVITTS